MRNRRGTGSCKDRLQQRCRSSARRRPPSATWLSSVILFCKNRIVSYRIKSLSKKLISLCKQGYLRVSQDIEGYLRISQDIEGYLIIWWLIRWNPELIGKSQKEQASTPELVVPRTPYYRNRYSNVWFLPLTPRIWQDILSYFFGIPGPVLKKSGITPNKQCNTKYLCQDKSSNFKLN